MSLSNTEQIKDRLSIVDVVGSYIKLEKAGSNLKAKCPFHNEKTPSFIVSPARNTFYCFGCGEHGDIFSFIEKFEGVDFKTALKTLADKAGVELTIERGSKRGEHDRLYAILEEAVSFFEENLRKNKKVVEYLAARGLPEETINLWRLGFALPEWQKLHDTLLEKNYTEDGLLKVGLIKKGEKGDDYYDIFRDRIMFPIADQNGRVIAFSGRIFGEHPKAPKYVNSPETVFFNKSKVLYGFDKAKLFIRRLNFSLVVEGQTDLLMSFQSGFKNTVALSGTALTTEQLTLLKRLSNNIVLAFDADSAGIASAGRSAELALAMGMNVKVAALPKGTDPADMILKDKNNWREAIKNAKHIIDFYLDVLGDSEKDQRTFALKVHEIVLPYIARISNKMDQAHFISKIANRLNMPEEPIRTELERLMAAGLKESIGHVGTQPVEKKEKQGLVSIEDELVGILLVEEGMKDPAIDTKELRKKLKEKLGKERLEELVEKYSAEKDEQFLFEIEALHDKGDQLQKDVEILLLYLEEAMLRKELGAAMFELKRAESVGDNKAIELLLKTCQRVSADIAHIHTQKSKE